MGTQFQWCTHHLDHLSFPIKYATKIPFTFFWILCCLYSEIPERCFESTKYKMNAEATRIIRVASNTILPTFINIKMSPCCCCSCYYFRFSHIISVSLLNQKRLIWFSVAFFSIYFLRCVCFSILLIPFFPFFRLIYLCMLENAGCRIQNIFFQLLHKIICIFLFLGPFFFSTNTRWMFAPSKYIHSLFFFLVCYTIHIIPLSYLHDSDPIFLISYTFLTVRII